MKKLTIYTLPIMLASIDSALAEGPVYTGATAMSKYAVPETYTLMPYITVSTSPYIAQKTAFDASDIWSQQSSMNEDLFLLQYKQQLEHNLEKLGTSLSLRPIVEISGAIEGMALQTFNNFHNNQTKGDINLNTAELDINAMASRWATAFLSIDFDSSPPQTGSRVTNSRLYLSRGFATIGNLDVTPVYFTIGQMYLPFGRYSSNMVTTPLTLSLARINDRAAVLGYYDDGFYGQAYIYPGVNTNSSDTILHAGGFNLGCKFPFSPEGKINIGGGIVSDMTDSQGMGNTGANTPQFPGFTNIEVAEITTTYPFQHVIPGGDLHTEVSWGPWSLSAEYISALSRFSTEDMTFDGHGASPKAAHFEVARNFEFRNHLCTAGASYGHSWQALALNLPENSITAYIRTSWWKNTLETIEFRHDIDYSSRFTSISAVNFGDFFNQGTGKSRDMVLAQLGVYF